MTLLVQGQRQGQVQVQAQGQGQAQVQAQNLVWQEVQARLVRGKRGVSVPQRRHS